MAAPPIQPGAPNFKKKWGMSKLPSSVSGISLMPMASRAAYDAWVDGSVAAAAAGMASNMAGVAHMYVKKVLVGKPDAPPETSTQAYARLVACM